MMPGITSMTSARSASGIRGASSMRTVTSRTALMQDMVMLDELGQRQRHAVRGRGQKDSASPAAWRGIC